MIRNLFILVLLLIVGCAEKTEIKNLPIFGNKEFVEGVDVDTLISYNTSLVFSKPVW